MITNLKTMPYAQAHVIIGNDKISLQSYNTIVAEIFGDKELVIYGLYSMTTRKHIKAFVKEYIPFEIPFSTIKVLANYSLAMDLLTGTVYELED